jgi:hypothetical protein
MHWENAPYDRPDDHDPKGFYAGVSTFGTGIRTWPLKNAPPLRQTLAALGVPDRLPFERQDCRLANRKKSLLGGQRCQLLAGAIVQVQMGRELGPAGGELSIAKMSTVST